jgi:hypothetical protein
MLGFSKKFEPSEPSRFAKGARAFGFVSTALVTVVPLWLGWCSYRNTVRTFPYFAIRLTNFDDSRVTEDNHELLYLENRRSSTMLVTSLEYCFRADIDYQPLKDALEKLKNDITTIERSGLTCVDHTKLSELLANKINVAHYSLVRSDLDYPFPLQSDVRHHLLKRSGSEFEDEDFKKQLFELMSAMTTRVCCESGIPSPFPEWFREEYTEAKQFSEKFNRQKKDGVWEKVGPKKTKEASVLPLKPSIE